MKIKLIKTVQTYPIRHKILRPGQSIESCYYPYDEDKDTFHLGVFEQDNLVSIASFYKETRGENENKISYRIRGMATFPPYRNKGNAKAMIKFAIEQIKKSGGETIWCNARVSATGLYSKIGMKIISKPFEIAGIGIHVVMEKEINR